MDSATIPESEQEWEEQNSTVGLGDGMITKKLILEKLHFLKYIVNNDKKVDFICLTCYIFDKSKIIISRNLFKWFLAIYI